MSVIEYRAYFCILLKLFSKHSKYSVGGYNLWQMILIRGSFQSIIRNDEDVLMNLFLMNYKSSLQFGIQSKIKW